MSLFFAPVALFCHRSNAIAQIVLSSHMPDTCIIIVDSPIMTIMYMPASRAAANAAVKHWALSLLAL